jgi:hypothetical protein
MPIPMSPMVANMLESFAGIVDLGLSPEDCLVYLEDQLQQVGLNVYDEVKFFLNSFKIYVCYEFAFFHFVLFKKYFNLKCILVNSK